MKAWARNAGPRLKRKRVGRLLRLKGLEAIYPKSEPVCRDGLTSAFLTRFEILRSKDATMSVVTKLPPSTSRADSFSFLVVIDWFSRHVLACEISVALDTSFAWRHWIGFFADRHTWDYQHGPGRAVYQRRTPSESEELAPYQQTVQLARDLRQIKDY